MDRQAEITSKFQNLNPETKSVDYQNKVDYYKHTSSPNDKLPFQTFQQRQNQSNLNCYTHINPKKNVGIFSDNTPKTRTKQLFLNKHLNEGKLLEQRLMISLRACQNLKLTPQKFFSMMRELIYPVKSRFGFQLESLSLGNLLNDPATSIHQDWDILKDGSCIEEFTEFVIQEAQDLISLFLCSSTTNNELLKPIFKIVSFATQLHLNIILKELLCDVVSNLISYIHRTVELNDKMMLSESQYTEIVDSLHQIEKRLYEIFQQNFDLDSYLNACA
ncbi:UNKNOWN [Stylonychia lemnae]|uniref:Uncharacterized protein n=1 Tax=Stylonychia lemnae TaxID=5949 RepID=A0A078B6F7_STYLE|nr:UNKNOWN [Stylonychia lemnae]|eukprot:CDW90115.1 UNKNOWN [Stylonychia lemnae]